MMKKFTLLLSFLLIVASVSAQEEELNRGPFQSDGFVGPVLKMTAVNDRFNLVFGLRANRVQNSRLAFGISGYGLVEDIITDEKPPRSLELDYGGLELEYAVISGKPGYFSVQTLLGAGRLTHQLGYTRFHISSDLFFISEPQLTVVLRATDFFYIGLGVSYRFVRGVDKFSGVENAGLNGLSATLNLLYVIHPPRI